MKIHSRLSVKNIKKEYRQGPLVQHTLRGVSVEFKQGTSYAIIGASGCGKTTLMHILSGLDKPTSGDVFFDSKNINKMPLSQHELFLNKSIGLVFQFHYLINELTVLENVMLPGLIARKSNVECESRAEELITYMGIESKKTQYPSQISGGEQQRVAIARAIFNKPSFVLADEPTGNLDEENAALVIDLFLKCQHEWNLGLILSSHDRLVFSKMDVLYVLHNGLLSLEKH